MTLRLGFPCYTGPHRRDHQMKKWVRDLWDNPFLWLAAATVIALRFLR
jgi:hypothetical protein